MSRRQVGPASIRPLVRGSRPVPPPRAEFLLEVGCEEIPAWMIEPACRELKALLEKPLRDSGLLETSPIEVFGGPRRLTAVIPALLRKQPDVTKEVTGPSKAAAFDAQGNPTRAAAGFAAGKGVAVKDLYTVQLPKGEFIAARQLTKGRAAEAVLADVIPAALAQIPWPKTMRWPVLTKEGPAQGNPRFIRPVRWLVALLAGKVVPFEFGGVKTANRTVGHRTLGKRDITVKNAADYNKKLRSNFVLVSPAERARKISDEIAAIAAKRNLRVHEDADLLDRVAYLNEYPGVILGSFDPAFLALPSEILITVMRDHQKYFALEEKRGALAPHFLAVINSDRDRAGKMRAGHERVLRARFADAQFFWESDQVKCRLADNLPKLDAVTYEASLGSYGLKVRRMRRIAAALDLSSADSAAPDRPSIDRAASLAKCDLVTEMVREFTELQGVVGGLYARSQGESAVVADAIYDHYLPAGLDDDVPRTLTGCAVALADKLDALVACFAVGKIPSGSSDPFALRRAALGIVRIVLDRRITLSLRAAVQAGREALAESNPTITQAAGLNQQLADFIADRVRFYFTDRRGYALDEVRASLAAGSDDLLDLADRLDALRRIRRTENFPPLAAAFKRIRNILEKSAAAESIPGRPDPATFVADEERDLHVAAEKAARSASSLKQERKYAQALEHIAAIRPTVDRFFDKVMVMAEDRAVRANRLALLRNLLREFSTIADFSEIQSDQASRPKT